MDTNEIKIINETKNTYDDIKYMYRKAKLSPLIIGCRFFFVIAGLYMFAEAMRLIQKNVAYFNYVSASGNMDAMGVLLVCLIVLMFLLGIFFIVFNFYFLKLSIYRSYKKIYSKWSARHIEFGEDALLVSFEENGIKSNSSIQYDIIDSYSRCNNALYIALKNEKKANKYLCLHDDCYLQGNVDDLVALLEKILAR